MSHAKILIRALPNVEFVHGFPGIPAGPDRAQATIRGTVEVRLGKQPVKAKYVKVELRKIETIPSGIRGEEFVDLVGQNPISVWEAQDDHDHDTLSNDDFPFNIRVPETIPPSVALERGAGIKYEVVATLCTKGKKGLFRRETSTPVSYSVPVVIDKHELHSTWPVYAQPESRQVVSKGLILTVDRSNTCFAPGDRLAVIATLKSDNLSPVVLRGFEFSLRETIIYRGGPHSHGKKNDPLVQTSVLGEQKLPVSMTLYGGTHHRAELGCMIPGNHTTSSVNAGRHIDIAYSLNIKAIIDMSNPVVMDLPVTITNWPRHVSAEMMRRIGTAPNLTLVSTASPRSLPASVFQTLEPRPRYGPPHPPPSGGLPSLPNRSGSPRTVPPGALLSGPPGSPNLSQYSTSMNPYSFQQNPYSTVVRQSSPQLHASSVPEVTNAAGSDSLAANNRETPDEFGYTRQPVDVATAPSRQGEKHDFGLADADQRSSTANSRSMVSQSASELDASGSNGVSQYSQDSDVRTNVVPSPPSSTGRRTHGISRTLKIVNVNDDIPEEESPVRREASFKSFDMTSSASLRTATKPTSPPGSSSSASPWPTAGEEKQRLYETAKAKAQKIQAEARAAGDGLSQPQSPRPSNGHVSPPRQASPVSINQSGGERSGTTSPSLSRTPWPTAEEEKRKLFEQAQAKVRRKQDLVDTSPSFRPVTSPAPNHPTGSASRPSHQRSASSNSSQDSQANRGLAAYTSTDAPTISAGAALYSHAMAFINRSASTNVYIPPANTLAPRRNASHTGASPIVSGNGVPPPARQAVSRGEDMGALRYYEARNALQRQQLTRPSIPEATPQEGPIPYEELFGSSSDASPPSVPGTNGTSPQLSEKEAIRRVYEARDAAAAATHTPLPPAVSPVVTTRRSPSVRTMTPPAGPSAELSEKEVLRRAFEARDAAILRAGQTPPPTLIPLQPTPPPASYSPPVAATSLQPIPSVTPSMHSPLARSASLSGNPPSSNGQPPSTAQLSEKEQMRLAFEARDRAIVAQHVPPPPDYEMPLSQPAMVSPAPVPPSPPPPPPIWSESNGSPLSTQGERGQLNARYAATDADPGRQSPSPEEKSLMSSQSEGLDLPGSPIRAPSHKSHRSDTSETFLRRDPSISAGKKRASQMASISPPPPPLPPRPPAEYIEETKLEDRRNTLMASVMIPPSDFSAPFDLGFGTFSTEPTPYEQRSG